MDSLQFVLILVAFLLPFGGGGGGGREERGGLLPIEWFSEVSGLAELRCLESDPLFLMPMICLGVYVVLVLINHRSFTVVDLYTKSMSKFMKPLATGPASLCKLYSGSCLQPHSSDFFWGGGGGLGSLVLTSSS